LLLIGYLYIKFHKLLLKIEETNETDDPNKLKAKRFRNFDEKGISNAKLNELKALETYIAKTNANTSSQKNSYFNMLSGNEDVAQIYAYILQNQTKSTYKEIVKFRKRTNYFEFLTVLFQKALNEEINQEISEWANETIEWLQKRNSSIIGHQLNLNRKSDTFMIVTNKNFNSDVENETNATPIKNKQKRKKSKKYKLLIPLDLDINEKVYFFIL
jgi:hypothetical protein